MAKFYIINCIIIALSLHYSIQFQGKGNTMQVNCLSLCIIYGLKTTPTSTNQPTNQTATTTIRIHCIDFHSKHGMGCITERWQFLLLFTFSSELSKITNCNWYLCFIDMLSIGICCLFFCSANHLNISLKWKTQYKGFKYINQYINKTPVNLQGKAKNDCISLSVCANLSILRRKRFMCFFWKEVLF